MPETRLERLIFVLGLVAAAALVAVIVQSVRHGPRHAAADLPPATAATAPAAQPPAATTVSVATTASVAPAATTTRAPVRKRLPAGIALRLTAARGASWLEVRAGSKSGRILYAQTLRAGGTRTFHGRSLWVRLGGASHVDATLNGKPLPLPTGTYSTVVTAGGLGPLGS